MTDWRRFEKGAEYFSIRREGIRCFLRWGADGTKRGGSLRMTCDDEQHAERHMAGKIRERLRKGFVEVAGQPAPTGDPEALVAETIGVAPLGAFRPVPGYPDVVCHEMTFAASPGRGFYRYLVLRDAGRSAISFNVRETTHDPIAVAAFLDLLVTVREPPFDGRSHAKLPLPEPVGEFTHALLCSPALAQMADAYPAISARVAGAFPIHDCEIGDDDTEVLVDARIHGHGALNYADWARGPKPVVDLRLMREKTFKVYDQGRLDRVLRELPGAAADGFVELRSYRGDVLRLTPADTDAAEQAAAFIVA
ncbi:WGR domain-containing protein [Actinoplanes bogorensis]|uniref:WGR domain-containing protein n=1 Tax=Paractinoplanes bogorensis TaxID=1610840 RepID=A0ABS5YU06_9ACTN|nr:WGR domain-containing protein [Actinoplanes bogorensis]MBU2666546.1 WGR domain-containing protein [Actinoplanes bogorensis]